MKNNKGIPQRRRHKFICCIFAGLCFIYLSNPAAVFSSEKYPPKPKPKKIYTFEKKLPTPFDRWTECDAVHMLYPEYNCKDETIDQERAGSVSSISIWKNGNKKRLLMLFETYYIEGIGLAGAPKLVDIGLFDIGGNRLKLTASAKDTLGYRWDGGSQFDLALYRLNSKEIAFGIRHQSGINGDNSDTLTLFRIEGNALRAIFSREMSGGDYDYPEQGVSGAYNSVLSIITKHSGTNDIRITTKFYPIKASKEDHDHVLKTTVENWAWNEEKRDYKLINSFTTKK